MACMTGSGPSIEKSKDHASMSDMAGNVYRYDDGVADYSREVIFWGTFRLASLALCVGAALGLGTTVWEQSNPNGSERKAADYTTPNHLLDVLLWVVVLAQTGAIHFCSQPATRLKVAIAGLTTALVSGLLRVTIYVAKISDYTSGGLPNRSVAALIVRLLPVFVTVVGFASIPRRPGIIFKGLFVKTSPSRMKYAFDWAKKTFQQVRYEKIQLSNLPILGHDKRSRSLDSDFVRKAHSGRLWYRLMYAYARPLLIQFFLASLKSLFSFASPYLVFAFLQALEARKEGSTAKSNLESSVAFIASNLLLEISINNWLNWWTSSQLELPVRALLSSMVFEKAAKLPICHNLQDLEPTGKKGQPAPQDSIINLMKLDSGRITMFCLYGFKFPLALSQLVWTLMFLNKLIRWKSVFAGLSVLLLMAPLTKVFSRKSATMQFDLSKYRDLRTKLLSETLQSIRQIRFSAAEQQWEEKIVRMRDEEMKHIWKGNLIMFYLVLFVDLGPVLLAAVSLSVFAFQDGELTPSVVFTALGLIEHLKDTVGTVPLMGTYLWEAWISCNRLEQFLARPEKEIRVLPAAEVSCQNADISWSLEDIYSLNRFSMTGLNLKFPVGELSIISGKTGSGKSLLLAAIIDEARIITGQIKSPIHLPSVALKQQDLDEADWILPSTAAFVSQPPWIEETTIRENVLFGLPFRRNRYNFTIYSCSLIEDLEVLPRGDQTPVGKKGVSLSGGQRWRIALARALYSRAEILIMDDVLSAVDAGVGSWLIENALCGRLCEGRTRILATHNSLDHVPYVRYRVCLGEGAVRSANLSISNHVPGVARSLSNQDAKTDEKSAIKLSPTSNTFPSLNTTNERVNTPNRKPNAGQTSSYKWKAHLVFLKASGGWPFWMLAIATILGYQLLTASGAWWLKIWASSYIAHGEEIQTSSKSIFYYVAAYLSISVATCVASAVQALVLYSGGIRASKTLYGKMVHAVLRAPLRWIDTVPTGKVLNCFISDFNIVDQRLALDLGFLLEFVFRLLTITAASLSVSSRVIKFAFALLCINFIVARQYLPTARDLRRLKASTNSSMLDHFLSVNSGLTTIRTFNRTSFYSEKMHDYIDDNLRASWYLEVVSRWMDFRLGISGAIFVTVVALMVVLDREISPAAAGFALTFALQYTKAVAGLLRKASATEAGIIAVERIMEYLDLPTESESGISAPDSWPSEGAMEVSGLVATYDINLPPVLKNISFSIAPHRRIGIVGRTGAGKSSLASAIFRFIEPVEGSIRIDELDISTLKLQDLRRRLCIVPQDPFLFSGTLRDNLDIYSSKTDCEIYDALAQVQLIPSTRIRGSAIQGPRQSSSNPSTNMFQDLSLPISDGGANFSHGQRQLICLARAILDKPKIILLDEATSSVDQKTDTIVQRVLRTEFSNSTCIVIAHRLSTIADFDTILVLDQGKIHESGNPAELFGSKGLFWKFVRQSSEKDLIESIIANSSNR